MGLDNIESTFEFNPCTNYLVIPRLPVNEITKPFVSFQLSELCQRPAYRVRHTH